VPIQKAQRDLNMTDIVEEATETGLWLNIKQDGLDLFGAYLQNTSAPTLPFTIFWIGRPVVPGILSLCGSILRALDVRPFGKMNLKGRALVLGEEITYRDNDWMKAAMEPKADLVRLECLQNWQKPDRVDEEAILWARIYRTIAYERLDEENIGVKLPLSRLLTLENELATLVANSQISKPDVGIVRNALRVLNAHLTPRNEPSAATAAA
jgi:hypothetical protein